MQKQPVHSVVGVLCDVLADLPPEDQARTLQTTALALGVETSRTGTLAALILDLLKSFRPDQIAMLGQLINMFDTQQQITFAEIVNVDNAQPAK